MNQIKNSKVTRVVSTKITEEEQNRLGVIAKYLQSLGYIAKANTSEAARFLLRASMEWTFSHMNYYKARDVKAKQINTSMSNRINYVIQPANPSVSEVDKNLTDASGPWLEFMDKYMRLKRSLLSNSNQV